MRNRFKGCTCPVCIITAVKLPALLKECAVQIIGASPGHVGSRGWSAPLANPDGNRLYRLML